MAWERTGRSSGKCCRGLKRETEGKWTHTRWYCQGVYPKGNGGGGGVGVVVDVI